MTNITRRAYIEPLSYCQIIQQQYIENLWSELKDTADADGPYLVDRARKLHKEIMRYRRQLQDVSIKVASLTLADKSIFQLNKVCSLDQADPKFLKEYLREAEHRLSRLPPQDRGFLNAGALEWIKPFSVDKLEGLVYQLTNHRFGRLLLVSGTKCIENEKFVLTSFQRPSRWERQENGNRVYEYYGRSVIEALVWGGFIGLICAFIGIPVMLQTLKVTSAAGQAVTYLSFLLGFGVVAKALLSTFNLTLIATLAYAGILAANMRHG